MKKRYEWNSLACCAKDDDSICLHQSSMETVPGSASLCMDNLTNTTPVCSLQTNY
jgi:hypothetical protein